MRLRIELTTPALHIPWEDVLLPGRGLIYHQLTQVSASLATRLHDEGWGPHRMAPFGYGAPTFPRATPQRGRYAAGGTGVWELGSPIPELVHTLVAALSAQQRISWGGIPFHLTRLVPMEPPSFGSGRAELRTSTPVLVKPPPTRDDDGRRHAPSLLPYEEGFPAAFEHNLRRKGEALGLEPDITVERITWVGAKRSFAGKGGGRHVGAPLGVELRGAPDLLRALWCWGLGQRTSSGFGWVAA